MSSLGKKNLKTFFNILHSVPIAKEFIQKLRDDGWDNLIENAVYLYKKFEIDITDSNACYIEGQCSNQLDYIIVEHYYHFDKFNVTTDF